MLPDPLHPAIVHFPIVLGVLLPVFILGSLVALHRGAPTRTWLVAVAGALAFTGATYVAQETGEDEEERVEKVVGEAAIHEHEEAAERLLLIGGALVVLTAAGLAKGGLGTGARYAALVGALGLQVAVWQSGHTGGELVYKHGAASAYATPGGGAERSAAAAGEHEDHDD